MHWDKKVADELRKEGFTIEQISRIIWILAEHRQQAYLQGFERAVLITAETDLNKPALLFFCSNTSIADAFFKRSFYYL